MTQCSSSSSSAADVFFFDYLLGDATELCLPLGDRQSFCIQFSSIPLAPTCVLFWRKDLVVNHKHESIHESSYFIDPRMGKRRTHLHNTHFMGVGRFSFAQFSRVSSFRKVF